MVVNLQIVYQFKYLKNHIKVYLTKITKNPTKPKDAYLVAGYKVFNTFTLNIFIIYVA